MLGQGREPEKFPPPRGVYPQGSSPSAWPPPSTSRSPPLTPSTRRREPAWAPPSPPWCAPRSAPARNSARAGRRFRGSRTATHPGANSGRTWASVGGGAAAAAQSAAVQLSFTPPSRSGDSLCGKWFLVSAERDRGGPAEWAGSGDKETLSWCTTPSPLGSPHPQGLRMLRSTWNFLKRHKKKCIFLGTALGGG